VKYEPNWKRTPLNKRELERIIPEQQMN